MRYHYFTVVCRSLWRNKTFSVINISGLAIGMATCLLILLYVQYELGYDRYHEKAGRIVRVTFRGTVQGEKTNEASVMPPVAQAMKADYPEVEAATRLREAGRPIISTAEKIFRDNKVAYADANFFDVFTLPFLRGDAKTALAHPNTVVLSKTTTQKFFGGEDPMGKGLHLQGWAAPLTVTGVMQDIPSNSHFQFDLLASMSGLPDAQSNSWMTSNYFTYLVLTKGHDYKQLEVKLPQTVKKYIGPQMQQAMGMTFSAFRSQGNDLSLLLQPLTDIHLYSNFNYDMTPTGNSQYIYIFAANHPDSWLRKSSCWGVFCSYCLRWRSNVHP